jgi:hypothetical protein
MYFHIGGSLRRAAEWLRSEINPGTERDRIWNPLSRLLPLADQQAKLHHTSLWRWVQKGGQQARQPVLAREGTRWSLAGGHSLQRCSRR